MSDSRRDYTGYGRQSKTRRLERRDVVVASNGGAIRIAVFFMLVAVVFILLVYSNRNENRTMAASNTGDAYKYYTSIQVNRGDTLWSIASSYMTSGYGSVNAYIEEVKLLNHLEEDEIHAGEYLMIPYYSDEYKL